jgi:hypothetical protein
VHAAVVCKQYVAGAHIITIHGCTLTHIAAAAATGLYRDAEKQFKSAIKDQDMIMTNLELIKVRASAHAYSSASHTVVLIECVSVHYSGAVAPEPPRSSTACSCLHVYVITHAITAVAAVSSLQTDCNHRFTHCTNCTTYRCTRSSTCLTQHWTHYQRLVSHTLVTHGCCWLLHDCMMH